MNTIRNIIIGVAAVVALTSAALATDFTALRNDTRVHNELLGASVAYLIDGQCASIKLRRLYMVGQALSLQSYARGLGYTNAEISAYVDSPEEQARFRAIAEPYLAQRGAVKGDPESYCAAGRAEMQKGSYVGSLLKGG